MNFQDFQERVFNLAAKGDDSSAAYLTLAEELKLPAASLPEYFRKLRVAFLSNFTIQGLPEVFKVQGVFHNLWLDTYLSSYNQYAQEILNPDSQLYKFQPSLIYLIIDLADADLPQLKEMIQRLILKTQAKVVVCNRELESDYKNHSQVFVFDFDNFLSKIGQEKYWYTKYKELGDLRLAPDAFPRFAEALMTFAVAASGAAKKCLIMDLDNTLWQGIIGEDGYDNIVPDQNLQKHILDLYNRGIILAINSKNNESDVWPVFEQHPRMILRKNHLAGWRINWNDKSFNIKELAEELNLGLESFVFIDDDPFQQNNIKANFPEIAVFHPRFLENYAGFHSFKLTEEDIKRSQMYAEERSRKELRTSLKNVDDFLKQLQMELTIKKADPETISRIAQLTRKTNQFNLATRRYSEEDIKNFVNKGWHIYTMQAKDRFGDYGIIGVQMTEPLQEKWRIDNFLLSCRILGRGVEKVFLDFLLERAKAGGAYGVRGEFIPTPKNKPCESFYKDIGFELINKEGDSHIYEYDLDKFNCRRPDFIKVNMA